MGRAPAKKSGKRDDRFQPAPEKTLIVPMKSGTDVHTPDGKRWHVADHDLAAVIVALDTDDRCEGRYTAQLDALAASRPDRYGPVVQAVAAFNTEEDA